VRDATYYVYLIVIQFNNKCIPRNNIFINLIFI